MGVDVHASPQVMTDQPVLIPCRGGRTVNAQSPARLTEIEEPPVTTAAERALALEHWLLSATGDQESARVEWAGMGVAMLRCGTLFSAVRMPADWIEAAAGSRAPENIAAYLNQALNGGAVFVDTTCRWFYFLVPASTCDRWNVPGTMCLGPDTYLGVPRPGEWHGVRTARSYWCVEMDGPAALCVPNAVMQLAVHARYRMAQADDSPNVGGARG